MTHSHTPGPWHRNIKAGGKYPVIFSGRSQHVAIACQQQHGDETEANIDLIAAAPDLLNALRFILADENSTLDYETRLIIGNVINKATGE